MVFDAKGRALGHLWYPYRKHSPDKKRDALITPWRILPFSILEGRLNDLKKSYSFNGSFVPEQKRRCLTVHSLQVSEHAAQTVPLFVRPFYVYR
jgi:hypothetical protein